jgi:cyclic pyranopterin phosphate synthase
MPKEIFDSNYKYLPHSQLLSFEEITRLAKIFVTQGVQKIRLTGGEPLLRKNIEILIDQLSSIKTLDGKNLDLTLTTNGSLLARKARSLKDAGLNRITVSLDGLNDTIFKKMNDVDFAVSQVLEGIEAAKSVGLNPIKVNMVVKKGVNLSEIIPMTDYFLNSGVILRFIEYMDVGATNGWKMDEVVPSSEILKILGSVFELERFETDLTGETATRFQVKSKNGKEGEIGLISSVTQAFCGDCNRARLSTEGQLYLCLFASTGFDLRTLLREGANDQEIKNQIAAIWSTRADQYSMLRSEHAQLPNNGLKRVEMSYIGG